MEVSIENIIKNFNGKISIVNVTESVVHVMRIVESDKSLKGLQKKQLVIAVLDKLIDSHDEIPEKELLKAFVDNILPHVIDTIISVSNKKNFFMLKRRFWKCR